MLVFLLRGERNRESPEGSLGDLSGDRFNIL